MYEVLTNLQCMKRLVYFCPEEPSDEQKSTMWNPVGARVLINPSDIVSNGCTCARGARFDEHVSLDCKRAGVFTLTAMTQFNNEEELLATVLHATKVQLFSLLRVTPVSALDGIMRVNVDEDMPDTLRVTATLRNWTVSPGERGSSTSTPDQMLTDKHKMRWLVPVVVLQHHFHTESQSSSSQPQDIRAMGTAQPQTQHASSLGSQGLWELGTLHVITAAPRAEHAWRMSIKPPQCQHGRSRWHGAFLVW